MPFFSSMVLRIAALFAAVFVLSFCGMGDPRPVYKYLDVIFYVGAYLALAFTPSKWSAFQTGFCAGYAISMCPAIVLITILGAMGFPSGPAPPHSHLVSAVICNMILAVIALMSWYLQRDSFTGRTPSCRQCGRKVEVANREKGQLSGLGRLGESGRRPGWRH